VTVFALVGRFRPFRLCETHRALWSFGVAWILLAVGALGAGREGGLRSEVGLDGAFVVTQLPGGTEAERQGPLSDGTLRAPYGEGARLVLVTPDRSARVLTAGFDSACDPDVSFDARRILFAGKKAASDPWNIYEMAVDGSGLRQITRGLGDCRSPGYQSSLYTLKPIGVPSVPEYHVTFVAGTGTLNEYGGSECTGLYSCKLDGSAVRRLTYNLSSDADPFLMDDGRLLLASWQRARLDHGLLGRVGLFGVNLDGSDYALYAPYQGRRIKQMPCATKRGLVVFVEADRVPWDGAGRLSCVEIRQPLHSYRQITRESDGLFHSPSPLPDGRILVSRRPADGSGTHGVWRLDPATGKAELVFDDPRFHEIQAKLIHPRDEPDGRSTAVSEEPDSSALTGKLYCLNVYTSDLGPAWLAPGLAKRLRVLEGVPVESGEWRVESGESSPTTARHSPLATLHSPLSTFNGIPPLAQRRILGDIPLEQDGSFNVEVPANTPIELQVLDADGMALRSCGWIWVKDYARQGCVGCHEDPEVVPENWFVRALAKPSIPLSLPPERRRTVDFRRDVAPIIAAKCAPCHSQEGKTPLRLDGGLSPVAGPGGAACFSRDYESLLATGDGGQAGTWGKYVDPGRARTSPLVWRIFGRNTSRPWDDTASQAAGKPMPPAGAELLSDDQKQTFVEWIDLGALWDGIPGPDGLPGRLAKAAGEKP
jgi:hypothetical protein